MARDTSVLKSMGYDGDYGIEGEFFVEGGGAFGQELDDSILDYNKPPITQPGLWCQWTPTEDRMHIEWDGAEKFYNYTEWIMYIIDKILKPQGYSLEGEVEYHGQNYYDFGTIIIQNNLVRVC